MHLIINTFFTSTLFLILTHSFIFGFLLMMIFYPSSRSFTLRTLHVAILILILDQGCCYYDIIVYLQVSCSICKCSFLDSTTNVNTYIQVFQYKTLILQQSSNNILSNDNYGIKSQCWACVFSSDRQYEPIGSDSQPASPCRASLIFSIHNVQRRPATHH